MNRVEKRINELKKKKEKGLGFFLMGNWPDKDTFIEILRFIDSKNLADFLQIGVPFSDPVADGPIIRKASAQALYKGATLEKILKNLLSVREEISIPLILKTYANPLYVSGIGEMLSLAKESGISAIIIPDMPLEEISLVEEQARKNKIGVLLFAGPTTSEKRLVKISSKTSFFLSYTASHETSSLEFEKVLALSEKPVYSDFGKLSPEQAGAIAHSLDGIIMGWALTEIIDDSEKNFFKEIEKFAISIRKEIKEI
ncbi:MAG: tryptophan synthase subunit alpha [Elusimicrobia bacterium]|nr:tryptophan synthase subunit alpha [Elusimicrobiota bacterium]